MGLTSFSLIIALATFIFGLYARKKTTDETNDSLILLISVLLTLFALASGLPLIVSFLANQKNVLLFEKLAFVCLFGASLAIFRHALFFPSEKSHIAFNVVLFAIWLPVCYLSVNYDLYLGSAVIIEGIFLGTGRTNFFGHHLVYFGYNVGNSITIGLIFLSGLILIIRSFFLKDAIHKLQARLVAALLIPGSIIIFSCMVLIPATLHNWNYLIYSVLGSLIIILGYFWAIPLTRVFDLRLFFSTNILSTLFFLIAMIPVALFSAFTFNYTSMPFQGKLLFNFLFFGFWITICTVLQKILRPLLVSHSDYFKKIEKALNTLDYTKGRDNVLDDINTIFSNTIGSSSFSILVDNNDDRLKTIYPYSNKPLLYNRRSKEIEHALNIDMPIILKSDIITSTWFYAVRKEMLELFEALNAEAVIFAHEGHRVIGVFAFGPKKNGRDYSDYDFNGFKRISGKLFVLAFYIKNIAKESLLATVEQELKLSGQIIDSIQNNIDQINHPSADVAFISKSTHKLGGDFIDFVKISNDRYFFVIGDVAGKGLNASMSMIIIKSVLRTFLSEEKDFTKLVIKLNTFIKDNLPRGTFFAGLFGYIDFSKDMLFFINSGISSMYMYSTQFNNVIEIQGEGRVLGFVKDITPYIKLRKIALMPGSIILLATDGIIESESSNKERYGKERLQRCVSDFKHYPAEQIINLTYQTLLDFIQRDIEDDVTLVAIKYKSSDKDTLQRR